MVTSTKNEIQNRNCPKCNKKLKYNSRCNLLHANKMKALCRKCACNEPSRIEKIRKAHLGQKRPDYIGKKISKSKMGHVVSEKTRLKIGKAFKGKKLSKEHKEKIRNSTIGRKVSSETRNKLSKANIGNKHSEETKRKMRISAIKRIEKQHGQIMPNYSQYACQLFDWSNMYHGLNIQHAENGGEFHLKEGGYYADGYDEETNIWYEYYEKWHKNSKQVIRDEQRKKNIIEHLDCEFIEIKEWNLMENYSGN